jgi:putative ABC transport system ATP-binding protein
MIELMAVTKTFRPLRGGLVSALFGVNLRVDRGEFVTVIGPSGSGKSSLLFTVGALLSPTLGGVYFNGLDLYGISAGARAALRLTRMGFVFQTCNLLDYMTCLENVALPALLAGTPRIDADRRARNLLDRVGLADRFDHTPAELSVGERQRAALCRSLINGPEILLADEPTGNLDPVATASVMTLLRELNANGQTILMVTHNHKIAEQGGRVVLLMDGAVRDDRPSVSAGLVS